MALDSVDCPWICGFSLQLLWIWILKRSHPSSRLTSEPDKRTVESKKKQTAAELFIAARRDCLHRFRWHKNVKNDRNSCRIATKDYNWRVARKCQTQSYPNRQSCLQQQLATGRLRPLNSIDFETCTLLRPVLFKLRTDCCSLFFFWRF